MQKKQKIERPEEARFESTIELRNALHFRDERRLHSEGRTISILSQKVESQVLFTGRVQETTFPLQLQIALVIHSFILCTGLTKHSFMILVGI